MSGTKTDSELLQEFVNDRSEPAFQALVQRHVNLVYGTAFRKVGEEEVAREVTQNVFVTLVRRASALRQEKNGITGWLHQAALLEARLWWRGEYRRRRREQIAAELGTTMNQDESLLKALVGELDDGLMELQDSERQVLLLRYFEKRSHREVGVLLGTSEEAARKRIDRALERLTQFFRHRGYAVPATAATIATLEAASHAAPVGLAMVVAQAGWGIGGAASLTGLGLWFAKIMGLSKIQTVAISAIVAATPLVYQWHALGNARQENAALTAQRATLQASAREVEDKLGRTRETLRTLDDALAQVYVETHRKREITDSLRNGNDAHLYYWSEESDYVRVPKHLAQDLYFSEYKVHRYHDGQVEPDQLEPMQHDGSLSKILKETLGVSADQESRWKTVFQEVVDKYREMERAAAYVTNVVPEHFHIGDWPSMTVVTPAFPEQGETFIQRLRDELESTLGQERAEVVWKQGQPVFLSQLNHFGTREKYETVAVSVDDDWLSYWEGQRKPGEVHFTGGTQNKGGPIHTGIVPERFHSFVMEWKNKVGTNQ